MADTVMRAARDTTGGAQQAGRELAQSATRGAARKLMSEAGHVVLGAVVDRAVSRVDRVADRLEGVAESGGTGLREALTGRPAQVRPDRKHVDETRTVRARVGAAFSLVVTSAVKLLQFLQRLARQLLEALRRLSRRPRTALPEPEAAGADEAAPTQDTQAEDDEPGDRRESRAERHGRRTRSDAPDPTPERSIPDKPAVRRRRPAPPPTQARR